jgi:hypothetical protein
MVDDTSRCMVLDVTLQPESPDVVFSSKDFNVF